MVYGLSSLPLLVPLTLSPFDSLTLSPFVSLSLSLFDSLGGKGKNRRFHRTFCFKKGALLAKLGALLVFLRCAPSFNRVRS